MSPSYLLIDALAATAFFALLYRQFFRGSAPSLPPGPPRLPLFGNAFDLPTEFPWKQYAKWSEKYGMPSLAYASLLSLIVLHAGDVISLEFFGQTIIVFNSHSALKDSVLARSSAFTGRPPNKFLDMLGWLGSNIPMTTAGREWRERRRVFEDHFKPAATRKYRHVQTQKIVNLLKCIVDKPDGIDDHTREHVLFSLYYCSLFTAYTGAIILDVVYGYDVKTRDDHFIKINEDVMSILPYLTLPGALIVNTLPILGSLPPWMLGRHFAALVEKGRRSWQQVLYEPFEWVKEGMKNGTAKESLLRTSLADLNDRDTEEARLLAEGLGNAYFGLAHCTSETLATLRTFILNMVLNPHTQVKAREELDRVIGRERIPDFSDRPNLPYVNAILMETLRLHPTTPVGLPHTTEEDVVYDGFYIPKGAMVFANAWAILRDPKRYPEPDVFRPERYLSAEGRVIDDPQMEYAFGYGSRRCPGRHFADATLWLYMASVLAFFEIRKTKNEDGKEIPVDGEYKAVGLFKYVLSLHALGVNHA
ncbi:cytochrome P450 [Vararia minispora EC-137]|uniref:Cytochrome P450 n=1 Tax=Vararia minispora EC-137 TaxID=1314806 RepID=A0ACB8Q6R2_9AGAM|nr:cytochrome P450 [Vararia minispora EC-137]